MILVANNQLSNQKTLQKSHKIENNDGFVLKFGLFRLSLHPESTVTVCRWCHQAREESPGSTGYPTSESGSYWRQ
jgi:steroid 5-alpha reductase family enzyme